LIRRRRSLGNGRRGRGERRRRAVRRRGETLRLLRGKLLRGELLRGELLRGELLRGELLRGELLRGELLHPRQIHTRPALVLLRILSIPPASLLHRLARRERLRPGGHPSTRRATDGRLPSHPTTPNALARASIIHHSPPLARRLFVAVAVAEDAFARQSIRRLPRLRAHLHRARRRHAHDITMITPICPTSRVRTTAIDAPHDRHRTPTAPRAYDLIPLRARARALARASPRRIARRAFSRIHRARACARSHVASRFATRDAVAPRDAHRASPKSHPARVTRFANRTRVHAAHRAWEFLSRRTPRVDRDSRHRDATETRSTSRRVPVGRSTSRRVARRRVTTRARTSEREGGKR